MGDSVIFLAGGRLGGEQTLAGYCGSFASRLSVRWLQDVRQTVGYTCVMLKSNLWGEYLNLEAIT